ncbi:MAG: DUF2061 domain-containing protein [Candidatus Nanoarchaeia archaeon]|jgi:uncharacterized membrane protein
MSESRRRSIAKAITFRIIATLVTAALVFILTGDWRVTGIVGAVDALSKILLYYFHERAWERVHWGKQ